MSTSTPLVFRPSTTQRSLAALLCVGSWLVGVRALAALLENLPRMTRMLRAAEVAGEPTLALWLQLVAAVAAVLVAGGLLLLSIAAFLSVEGCAVLVDEIGISVEQHLLPGPLGGLLGSGRLAWKQVGALERSGPFFVLRAITPPEGGPRLRPLRFLLVENLDRLVHLILERSPNLHLEG
ncbi:MAG: hypothetical protein HY823_02640 [Acidobacteria bacterium]|nr:hypothetical protein [Acidobacteriota bacterium]